MRYDPEVVAVAFERLFRTYRFVEQDEADEMLRVYFEALADYETRDIEAGISNMLSGRVDGFNPSFLPPAPLVAKSVRQAMERRLDAARLDKLALPPPPDDFEQDPPEVRNRNKARLDALAASLAADLRSDDAERDRARKQIANKTNARFDPSLDPNAMARRLGVGTRYYVGDPEGDEGDMGQVGAA